MLLHSMSYIKILFFYLQTPTYSRHTTRWARPKTQSGRPKFNWAHPTVRYLRPRARYSRPITKSFRPTTRCRPPIARWGCPRIRWGHLTTLPTPRLPTRPTSGHPASSAVTVQTIYPPRLPSTLCTTSIPWRTWIPSIAWPTSPPAVWLCQCTTP